MRDLWRRAARRRPALLGADRRFLFLHILLLDETERVPASPTLRRLLIAAVLAPVVATVVMLTFERIFLVRLP